MHLPRRLSNKDLSCYYIAAAETECTVIRISFQGYYFPSQHQCCTKIIKNGQKLVENLEKLSSNSVQEDISWVCI